MEHVVGKKSCFLVKTILVDSELEGARHKMSIYAIENLNAEIVEEIDLFFNNSRCAAKESLDFAFFSRGLEDGRPR